MWVLRSQLRQFAVIVDISTRQHKQWVFVLSIIQWYAVIFKKKSDNGDLCVNCAKQNLFKWFFFIVFEKSDVDLFWNSVNFLCFVKLLRNLPKKITKKQTVFVFLMCLFKCWDIRLTGMFSPKICFFKFFNPRFFLG